MMYRCYSFLSFLSLFFLILLYSHFLLLIFSTDVSHFCALQLPQEPGSELNFPFGSNIKYLGHCSKRNRGTISSSLSDSDNDDYDYENYKNSISNSCVSLPADENIKFRFDGKYCNDSIHVHSAGNGEKEIRNKYTISSTLTSKIKAKDKNNNNCNNEINCKSLVSKNMTNVLDMNTHTNVNSDSGNDEEDNDSNSSVSEEHSASGECSEDAYQDINSSNDIDVDVGIQSENTSVEMSTESSSSSHNDSDTHSLSHSQSLSISLAKGTNVDEYSNICSKRSHTNYNNKHNLRILSQTECAANGLGQQSHGNSNGNMNNIVDNADSPITDGSDSP